MARYRAPRGYPTTLAVIRATFVVAELVILFASIYVMGKWPRLYKFVLGSFFAVLFAAVFDAAEVVGLLDKSRRCKRLSSNAMVCADILTTFLCAALPWFVYFSSGGLVERQRTPEIDADDDAQAQAGAALDIALFAPAAIAGVHFFMLILACSICCVPVARKNRFYTIAPLPATEGETELEATESSQMNPESKEQRDNLP